MSRLFQRKILVSLCLLIYLASGYGSAHAMVWCFGSDGHIGLKVALESGCTAASDATKHKIAGCGSSLVKSDCCGSCLDISTTYAARQIVAKRLEPERARTVVSDIFSPYILPPATGTLSIPNQLPHPPPSANTPLSHLKTVVLLN